jgi:hypothetical protein
MSERPETMAAPEAAGAPNPDQGDGPWPNGMPYTVQFPGDDASAADLEHPAPLPRAGDVVEYIDETGATHRYRVREVVHTLQTTSAHRPHVSDGRASPQAIARVAEGDAAEPPGEGGELRAGLPKVYLEALD